MRLKKLKLVGFKSFVDPTSVEFPSELVAVVGPNGCGKSNIIDAVRWVMGESSVKHLRGESMADVIFNGSSTRRPLGQASVELVFENNAGKLLGEYASYSEIAIKRLVTRDGSSKYYLNNTRCRRKDIVDIFLGTGLGPRSYSIISQGMVSEVVEARPEDLRGFLEEAAGISKYKERRRETENRIKHTRENLERINDIREELTKQLDKLSRQASVARRYQTLKEEDHSLTEKLALIRIKKYQASLTGSEQALKGNEQALLEGQTALTAKLSTLEEEKSFLVTDEEYHSSVQAEFYQKGRELAKQEEGLAGLKNTRKQLEVDRDECSFALKEYSHHIEEQSCKDRTLESDIKELEPTHARLLDEKKAREEKLSLAEKEQASAQRHWDQFNQDLNRASNDAHREQARVQHLEQSINDTELRIKKLGNEKTTLTFSELEKEQEKLEKEMAEQSAQKADLETSIKDAEKGLKAEKQAKQQMLSEVDKKRSELSSMNARLASLQALQEASLGKQNQAVGGWLKQRHLEKAARVAELIKVQSGYEVAADAVFDTLLSGVYLSEQSFESIDLDGAISLPLSMMWSDENFPQIELKKESLASVVETKLPYLNTIAAHILIAEDLEHAKSLLPTLSARELIVTKEGIILSRGLIKFPGKEKAQESVLAREKLLTQVGQECEEAESVLQALKANVEQQDELLVLKQQEKEKKEHELKQLELNHRSLAGQVNLYKERLSQFKKRKDRIDEEIEGLSKTLISHKETLQSSRDNWQKAIKDTERLSSQKETLTAERENLSQKLLETRQALSEIQRDLNDKSLALNSKRQERRLILQSLEKEKERLQKASNKQEEIELALKALSDEELQAKETALKEETNQHLELEERLKKLKIELDGKKEKVSIIEKEISTQRELVSGIEKKIGAIKLDRQSELVRLQTIFEDLSLDEDDLKSSLDGLDANESEQAVSEALTHVKGKIQRLGAVNLAAIEEHQEESVRKTYLDEQCADLEKALETLEVAISKIDKESKQRFKETFDLVNSEFKSLFPRLFGGGRAELICDSDDLLETGVSVIAQPPGKRNSTIHLLSGGEKAMTAVALVFSIFQLNPSPFCMLDEVDAPLDDANVSRYCQLVKEMSSQVQFIFITHNKLTMALASHLSGVTMNEPGVSRIVSVDVEKAVELAE